VAESIEGDVREEEYLRAGVRFRHNDWQFKHEYAQRPDSDGG